MKCPNCQSVLSLKNNRCDRCGEDVRVYKRVVKASNACYNQGLMKAKIRDLSGAVEALRKSLELDKYNTNARNLLGLVYFEMGEAVSALSEWVLSKHLQQEDNDADEYMSMVQSNPTKLDNINQAIKKYNQALASAKQGSPDLAIIQLKKVVTLNPKFIRAYQLLALLYIQDGDKDKAGKALSKASAIDINNTTTIRYMKELGITPVKVVREIKEEKQEHHDSKTAEYNVFSGMKEFKEDRPSIWPYLNLVIGVVVGIVAYYVLIGPNVTNKTISDLRSENTSLTSQLTAVTTDRDSYKEQVEKLTGTISEEATDDANATDDPNATPSATDDANAVNEEEAISALLESASKVLDDDDKEAAVALVDYTEDSFSSDAAKELYNTIKDNTFESAAKSLYSEGYNKYDAGKYEEAEELLTQACALKDDYEDAMYFLGRTYMQMEEYDKARTILEQLAEDHPSTRRGLQAASKLKQIPDTSDTEETATPTPTDEATE